MKQDNTNKIGTISYILISIVVFLSIGLSKTFSLDTKFLAILMLNLFVASSFMKLHIEQRNKNE